MRARVLIMAAIGIGLTTLSGCGQAPSSAAVPLSRSHDGIKVTLTWAKTPVQLKPAHATLTLSPASAAVIPGRGAFNMRAMNMLPLRFPWHEVKPGKFQGEVTPLMGGPWVLSVTLRRGAQTWQESYPVKVQN